MMIEGDLLISLLEHSKGGSVSNKVLNLDARFPPSVIRKLLRRMQKERLLNLRGAFVEINQVQRFELASRAVTLGADVERLSRVLHWKEFEQMAGLVLERTGFSVDRNVRFKSEGHRFEIDVVGRKEPLFVCIDCKHWHRAISSSALSRIVQLQESRTEAFARYLHLEHFGLLHPSGKTAIFVPAVLSIVEGTSKFCDNVPIVPVLRLRDFLNQLPMNVYEIRYFQYPNEERSFHF